MARVLRIRKTDVDAVSLDYALPYADWHTNVQFFERQQGEHYRLLASLVQQLNDGRISDIGTYLGYSALALAYRAAERGNVVTTYDIHDCLKGPRTALDFPGVRRVLKDAAEDLEDIAKSDVVLMDVCPHDGVQEKVMIQKLADLGFRGILILDDIHLNPQMEALWAWVPAARKVDVTRFGHWSGTGIAVFDPAVIDVEISF